MQLKLYHRNGNNRLEGVTSVYLYGQTAFQPLLNSFSTSQISLSAFFISLRALQISFSHFPPLKSAFQHFSFTGFQHSNQICFSTFQFFHFLAFGLCFTAFLFFSFSAFPLFHFLAFQLFCFSASLLFSASSGTQPLGLSASQISYLSSRPLFTLLRRLNGGRKK